MKKEQKIYKNLSNEKLHTTLLQNVKRERVLLTEILQLLLEVDQRRLFSDYRCSSTFDYAVKVLNYSDQQAARRIQAMRLLKVVPEVEEKLCNRELSLTTAAQVQQFVNKEENSAIAKNPDKPRSENRFKPVEKRKLIEEVSGLSLRAAQQVLLSQSSEPEVHNEKQRSIAGERRELKFSISKETYKKMKRVQGLLAHSKGSMNLGDFFGEVLSLAGETLKKRKGLMIKTGTVKKTSVKNKTTKYESTKSEPATHASKKSKSTENTSRSKKHDSISTPTPERDRPNARGKTMMKPRSEKKARHLDKNAKKHTDKKPMKKVLNHRQTISAPIKRQIWLEANEQCENCGSTQALEIDHIIPVAYGGSNDRKNFAISLSKLQSTCGRR